MTAISTLEGKKGSLTKRPVSALHHILIICSRWEKWPCHQIPQTGTGADRSVSPAAATITFCFRLPIHTAAVATVASKKLTFLPLSFTAFRFLFFFRTKLCNQVYEQIALNIYLLRFQTSIWGKMSCYFIPDVALAPKSNILTCSDTISFLRLK